MKIAFESNLQYQQDAIKSITAVFEGQPSEDTIREYSLNEKGSLNLINGIGNSLVLSQEQILSNLQAVQKKNELPISSELAGMNFSVEMETGTGKTYVYLRTVYELYSQYGFKKFVIVVPSVAIREGVIKNLEITHEHFQNLYDHVPSNFQVYDSSRTSSLRGFATADNIEILVINIDAFSKDNNVINTIQETGVKPVEYIQSANPIVIVDEPQNMETEKRKLAIENLKPLCTLRYSATHRNTYNLTYSLNPVRAYDLGLVKQIEVDSVVEENANNEAFVSLDDIKATKTKLAANLSIFANSTSGVKKKNITVKSGDDLYSLSNGREIYADGFIVDEIDASNGFITFENGNMLYKGSSQGGLNEEVMKFQMRRTIAEHLNKERRFARDGIKVLSLFFIDKVANYREYDAAGNPTQGKFAKWFEEIYLETIAKKEYRDLDKFPVQECHNGYFSADKKGIWKDIRESEAAQNSEAAQKAYHAIMRDKELLLDINYPLRFIFSHSALREGWDNPNVFQICTLNETKSAVRKRQEIGRGLRLAVDQTGNRVYDRNVNRLTVIANESYDDFARALQNEIEEDCGVEFKGRIKNKRERIAVKYRKGFQADPKFLEIWEKIKHHTTYRVDYDTDELVRVAAAATQALPEITAPAIVATKVAIMMSEEGVDTRYAGTKSESFDYNWSIPDVLGYIQRKTELTRSTVFEILSKSGRIGDILVNPQLFLDYASQAIRKSLYGLMINGIKYHKVNGSEYQMTKFEAKELETYLDEFTFKVGDTTKTIYDEFMPLDSKVENRFAQDCESSEQVKFYFKLPSWFKIATPIGTYNPDWAVVFNDEKKVYFVAETKDTGTPEVDLSKLTEDEQMKIKCGTAHFKEFDDLEYQVVNRVSQLARIHSR
ncbi:DEAD/DEAH box helicase family protein [Pontibacter vulgaris]|uniref:restriction endonuclease n=1 Tax=Pontibacter vulgaris TaxID=2905679 RepID=UPI001FA71CD2|nr:DEAD/DEAH box helicase family protein [Pontibacter vulgaris]